MEIILANIIVNDKNLNLGSNFCMKASFELIVSEDKENFKSFIISIIVFSINEVEFFNLLF